MSPDKPPPKTPKPFLGEDELSSELDAWDATFDALHASDEASVEPSAAAGDWPTPQPTPLPTPQVAAPAPEPRPSRRTLPPPPPKPMSRVPEPALAAEDPSHTLDDFPAFARSETDVEEVSEQMTLDEHTLDRPVPPPPIEEADFSDLSERPGTLPPIEDEGETKLTAVESRRQRTPTPTGFEEDEVYTSASRPRLEEAPNDPAFPEDPIAPPPRPVAKPATPPISVARTVSRQGPAIIRRTPVSIAVPKLPDDLSSDFGENTKIANVEEMEARAQESRRAEARSKAPTAPPPIMEAAAEEDFPDIEMAHDAPDEVAPEPAEAEPPPSMPKRTITDPRLSPLQPRRTVAHVVRRSTPAPGVPIGKRAESEQIVIETDEPPASGPIPKPIESPEDDFSDVAAAVGAGDSIPGDMLPRRQATPRGSIDLDAIDDVIDDALPTRHAAREAPPALDHIRPAEAHQLAPSNLRLEDAAPEIELGHPTRLDPGQGQDRPPGIMDFYPRVKTPTSVPPLGMMPEEVAARAPLPDDPSSTLLGIGSAKPAQARPVRLATPFADVVGETVDLEPAIDLEAIGADSPWPEQVQPLPTSQLDEDFAQSLLIYEREVATVDETAASAALRIEAGRLCERLGDAERARAHYDAALLADPRATAALRGLRRLARSSSDLQEATRQLDAEIAVAGALERRPLAHYRIDLLMASGEQDLARVAAGEILDSAPSDVRALLAQLELAFLDGRADEFGSSLEQLAHAVTDPELRAAAQSARAMLAANGNDMQGAAQWYAAASESDPGSLAARLGAIRHAALQANTDAVSRALVDLAKQLETTDALTAAAMCVRAQQWTTGPIGAEAAKLSIQYTPADPLVARVAAETSLAAEDQAVPAMAFAHWARTQGSPAERAFAAGRAAELDAAHAAELWSLALELDPGDDYAAAQLRTAHVAAEAPQLAIDVDLTVAKDVERDRARLRAAFGLIGQGKLDAAIELLQKARGERPGSLALAEALAESLAAAGRWTDRAKLMFELAEIPGEQLDRDVAWLRSALAWEEAVGAAAEANDPELQSITQSALSAWERVLEASPRSPTAHAAAIVLASRLGDRDTIAEVLARAQAAERSPWGANSLALRRTRLLAGDDPERADGILRDLPRPTPTDTDPRVTVWRVITAARRQDLAEAATALEDRAKQVDLNGGADTTEAAALRFRAAQLALDSGDAMRASSLLRTVERVLPSLNIVPDLLAAARRRAGDRSGPVRMRRDTPAPTSPAAASDEFARIVRDGDLAAAQNDGGSALSLYQQALELKPGDPIAYVPLMRVATQLREPAPIAALALAQLRAAETAGDATMKAEAYELLAQIDKDLRNDSPSAQIALESASQADPTRIDLMHRLEREYAVADNVPELLRLRRGELEQIPTGHAKDRASIIMDTAILAQRDQRPDLELTDLYRQALEADPKRRLALLYLESIVRRAGASPELAQLEEQIAGYFEGEPRTQAAFFTRAGETLTEIGSIDGAVEKFGKAEQALPGHVPALEGWRHAALKGQLWLDVAEATTRQAAQTTDAEARAKLHHFAGVVLMDKALINEQAQVAFRKALEADPSHRDSFLRLRILLEEDANHDDLAILLSNRLDYETDNARRIELHRAVAELHRNFLSDRETAKKHYRAILDSDPNDLRAHSAIADIAWELGNWQEAADALIALAKLHHDPGTLTRLCFRLGTIYADRLEDPQMALKAFQRALTYQPDDENTLARLADLATQAGEWKLALGACERLVKATVDPDKRVTHLHRVARIFKQGFNDMKRAERALNLALDGSPTNDDALTELVKFYRDAGDMTSVRVHLNRVAGSMRARVQQDPKDGVAYRVIARAMVARSTAGVEGSLPIARSAAELATLLGAAGDPERVLLDEIPRIDLSLLMRAEADEALYPRGVQPELRQVFQLLGDRVAKHVGVDTRVYGVGRGDRLRARDHAVAAQAQDVATGLGFGEIDVYVSSKMPYAMVAEPTSPVSLILGSAIAQGDPRGVRFAAGSALKLAQASLAIPARLPADDLGILVIALMRLFQTDFPTLGLDAEAINQQTQKLRRLIPTGLANELKPYALAVDAQRFHHNDLARDLRVTGLRAGLVTAGSLLAGLEILVAQAGTDIPNFLADPVAQGLVSFALSEDHAAIAR